MAAAKSGPDVRPSRPITIGPGGSVAAKAATYRTATSGVRLPPTMPRSPETLTIRMSRVDSLLDSPMSPAGPVFEVCSPRA